MMMGNGNHDDDDDMITLEMVLETMIVTDKEDTGRRRPDKQQQ